MKKIVFFITVLFLGKCLLAGEIKDPPDKIRLGDFIYGGVVFWIDSSGQHGLICSKSDQAAGILWSENIAMNVCKEYSVTEGGKKYDDWYLPSKEEMFKVYTNSGIIDKSATANGGSAFVVNNELSPTEYCNSPSWDQIFKYGYQDYDYKKSKFNVRAIRSF
jgi:hypothetical protein